MPPKSDQVGFRISKDGLAILFQLQEHYGLSQSGIFEMLLRERARAEGFKVSDLAAKLDAGGLHPPRSR